MNQDCELQENQEWDLYEDIHSLIEFNPWAWQSIGAVSGLMGGVLSPVIGTLLIAVTWFVHSERVVSALNGLSIVSFALTIPLLAIGAHCLDLLERKTARLSLEEQQSQGLAVTSLRDTEEGTRRRLKLTSTSVALAWLFLAPASGHAQQTIFNMPSTDVLDKGKVYFELDVSAKPTKPRFSSFVQRIVAGTGKLVEVGLNLTGNIQPSPDATVLVPAQRAGGHFSFEQTMTPRFTIAADWIIGKHASGYFTPGVIFKPHPRVTGYAGYSLGNANLRNGNHFLLLESGYTFN
ncbi:MAG: hypothetical protein M3Q91_18395 [Acidobacteriota bacterium]|nr:hypothetical protein [Acidobacteriota bacterium]